AINRKFLGPEHPNVAGSLGNLAVLYGSEKRYDEAEPAGFQAWGIRRADFFRNGPVLAEQDALAYAEKTRIIGSQYVRFCLDAGHVPPARSADVVFASK